jgi:hypothetical protein
MKLFEAGLEITSLQVAMLAFKMDTLTDSLKESGSTSSSVTGGGCFQSSKKVMYWRILIGKRSCALKVINSKRLRHMVYLALAHPMMNNGISDGCDRP